MQILCHRFGEKSESLGGLCTREQCHCDITGSSETQCEISVSVPELKPWQ